MSAAVKKLGDSVTDSDLQTELNSSVGNGKTTVSTNGDDTLNVNFTDTKHNYTVDGGTVTRTADGEVEVVPTGQVARIGTTYYETLQDAFDSVSTNNTKTEVILLANISENVLVIENQNILLNLNNKTITNVEGTADAGDWNQAAIEVRNTGTIEIKNGNITASYGCGVENYGTTIIDSGNYSTTGSYQTVYNEGTLTINGGTFSAIAEEGNQGTVYNFEGTLTINGGTFSSLTEKVLSIFDSSNVYINDGSFRTENNQCIYCVDSYLKIEGGTFTTAYGAAVVLQTGSCDIYGGIFTGSSDFWDLEADNFGNPINVYGGTYSTYSGDVIIH